MPAYTIDISMSGLTIAEQMLTQVVAFRDDAAVARQQSVERHARELAQFDATLALFDARIAELEDFIAHKTGG